MSPPHLSAIRTQAPLIHNIINLVVMNSTANALLAPGASPVMVNMGIAGESTAVRASGPGSFQLHFPDVLHGLREAKLELLARLTRN